MEKDPMLRFMYNNPDAGRLNYEEKRKRKKNLIKAAAGIIGVGLLALGIAKGISKDKKYDCYKTQNYETSNVVQINIGKTPGICGVELKGLEATAQRMQLKETRANNKSLEEVLSKIPEAEMAYYIKNYQRINMPEKYWNILNEFSKMKDIALVAAIIESESTWNERCISECGASGLMQIMRNSVSAEDWKNRFDPYSNIRAGIKILNEKESYLKFCEPPEWLKERDSARYYKLRWEHLKLVLAAYNGGQSVVRDAVKMASRDNGKAYWEQEWKDLVPYVEKACSEYYSYPKDKAKEIINYVDKIMKNYNAYRVEFEIRKKLGEDFKREELIKEIKKREGVLE
ncbi:MAG: transglycosylase SLT domain-containing protein [Candidatus Woesearchaeota archaeon]